MEVGGWGGGATAATEADLAIQLVDMGPSDRLTPDKEMDKVCRADLNIHRTREQPRPAKPQAQYEYILLHVHRSEMAY